MNRRTVLKGGLVVAIAGHTAAGVAVAADPLAQAIRDYRAGKAAYCVTPTTSETEDAVYEMTIGRTERIVDNWDQPALTREGAIEALKLMEEEEVFIDKVGERMCRAVLGYLEGLPA